LVLILLAGVAAGLHLSGLRRAAPNDNFAHDPEEIR